ncbi:MAG: aminotransferase class V-fold PLP-dependent enzyme, partial [Nitrososphaeraceae archaeon]|nr:aminotransferase class V-fold PLP-dependent enzyme [Nitrososphaeraceae archaeon]
MNKIYIEEIRKYFPSIQKKIKGKIRIFLDGAGGTQVPGSVINSMVEYLENNNANQTGVFKTSLATEELLINVRKSIADFINAPSWEEIIIGPNMTTITYGLVFAFSRYFKPGDEIIVSRLDHGANIDTWKSLQDFGIKIKYIEVNTEDCTLNYDMLESLLTSKTKLIAVGLASNAVGTINDIKRFAKITQGNNILLFVDAVHAAPHIPIDVE